jgi:hypothetical protein
MISAKLHPEAMEKVYMPMTNILLDTHDITMASIVRDKVDPEMSIEDIEEAMAEVAIERNIKDVGQFIDFFHCFWMQLRRNHFTDNLGGYAVLHLQ